MDEPLSRKVTWFVIFAESGYKAGIMHWLQPGFSHVYAIKKTDHGNFWQVVNPRLTSLEIKQVLVSQYPTARDYAGPDGVVLEIEVDIPAGGERGTLCWFNCVEVVKALLGIRSFWTFTPWQLYKYLRINHGRRIRIKSKKTR